jgi:hypothetical protein
VLVVYRASAGCAVMDPACNDPGRSPSANHTVTRGEWWIGFMGLKQYLGL